MKTDIENKEQVKILVDAFYEKVRSDETIGYLFTDVARVNWEKHLPVMYAFWENILLMNGAFSGNPMVKHIQLHRLSPLTKEHFNRWIELFNQTVDEYFEGANADRIKQKAYSIATVMQVRIDNPGNNLL